MEKCLHSITFGEKKKSTIVSLSNSSTKFTYIFLWQSLEFLLTTQAVVFFSPPTLKMQYKNGEELLAQKCLTNGPFFAKKMSFA